MKVLAPGPAAAGAPEPRLARRTALLRVLSSAPGERTQRRGAHRPAPRPIDDALGSRVVRAFTLIEMLIALALVTLVLTAIVFNFNTLGRGAQLDEGTRRIKTALTLARAHAANTQRPVRLVFEEDEQSLLEDRAYLIRFAEQPLQEFDEDALSSTGGSGLFGSSSTGDGSEAEGAGEGGIRGDGTFTGGYRQVTTLVTPQEQVNGIIAVFDVRPLDRSGSAIEEEELDLAPTDTLPPIEFYPDGSSESAEIIIGSRDPDDTRRMRIRIVGMTGRITSSLVPDEEDEQDGSEQPATENEGDAPTPDSALEDDPGFRIDR